MIVLLHGYVLHACVHLYLHECVCTLSKPYCVTSKLIALTSNNLAAMTASLLRFFYSTSHCLSLIPYLILSGNSIHKLVYSFNPLLPPDSPTPTNHCLSFWCPFPSICITLHQLPPPHLSFIPYNLLTFNNLARWSLFKRTICVCGGGSKLYVQKHNFVNTNTHIFICTNKTHRVLKHTHTFCQTENRPGGCN